MAATTATSTSLTLFSQNPNTTPWLKHPCPPKLLSSFPEPNSASFLRPTLAISINLSLSFTRNASISNKSSSSLAAHTLSTYTHQFYDGNSEVELRLQLGGQDIRSSEDIFVDANETSLTIRVQHSGFIDNDQLVVNLKKQDPDLKWPDIMESWDSLRVGSSQLLKGASIYIIGESTDINQQVAQELAAGIGYAPLSTKELLENFAKQTIHSWVLAEGFDSVAEAESAILECLSSHVRTVVATLGGQQGIARRVDKWRHLYAGFTIWLSQTEATDEDSAKEEAKKHIQDSNLAYSKADAVVKFQGWDLNHAQSLAQASLSALKRLILSDKKLPGKKSLYIRLGCHGDWPNIKPPGWDPSAGDDAPPAAL